MTNKSKILVFASGSAEGGGSGFEKLVEASRCGPARHCLSLNKDSQACPPLHIASQSEQIGLPATAHRSTIEADRRWQAGDGRQAMAGRMLDAEIIAVVSNHANGGVSKRADKLGIPFLHFPKPWNAEGYQNLARETGADFFALSGWLKLVTGLDPETSFNSKTVFNIHPGPLPEFGGTGMYGHFVHEAVMEAFKRGEIKYSAVSMHFVTEGYDRGPVFFDLKVKIKDDDTPESLGQRVNQMEHQWQPFITKLVVNGSIRWDGVNHDSLKVPPNYSIENFE